MKKTVVTVTGIRPDFIRMSKVFERLDASEKINHVLIHTGQHYNQMLSEVFFDELKIRPPDYNLQIGGPGVEHFEQLGKLSTVLIHLLREEDWDPDLILFLGDSNSAAVSMPLKKEGYRIGHIEAGMRSGDKRMLEEINRTVCDHCSDFLFTYHSDYAMNLYRENIFKGVSVVGNTIVEVCRPLAESLWQEKKSGDYILLDIHRPENFNYLERLRSIFLFALYCQQRFKVPVKFLGFPRTIKALLTAHISTRNFEPLQLMSYKQFLRCQYHSLFMISDSGTAQEEPALLNTPVVVPREFTERPQSMANNNSFLLAHLDSQTEQQMAMEWVEDYLCGNLDTNPNSLWLGAGTTSEDIVRILEEQL